MFLAGSFSLLFSLVIYEAVFYRDSFGGLFVDSLESSSIRSSWTSSRLMSAMIMKMLFVTSSLYESYSTFIYNSSPYICMNWIQKFSYRGSVILPLPISSIIMNEILFF